MKMCLKKSVTLKNMPRTLPHIGFYYCSAVVPYLSDISPSAVLVPCGQQQSEHVK